MSALPAYLAIIDEAIGIRTAVFAAEGKLGVLGEDFARVRVLESAVAYLAHAPNTEAGRIEAATQLRDDEARGAAERLERRLDTTEARAA